VPVKTLKKGVPVFKSAEVPRQRSPDQGFCGRSHVETHPQPFSGFAAHDGGKELRIDLGSGVFHGEIRVSISVRFNFADHVRR